MKTTLTDLQRHAGALTTLNEIEARAKSGSFRWLNLGEERIFCLTTVRRVVFEKILRNSLEECRAFAKLCKVGLMKIIKSLRKDI